MKLSKGATTVMEIASDGGLTISGFYQDEGAGATAAGQLAVKRDGNTLLDSAADGAKTDVRLAERLFPSALLPASGLVIKNDSNQPVAVLDADGNLRAKGALTSTLSDPGAAGAQAFDDIVYAAPAVNYKNLDPLYASISTANPYLVFEAPTADYQTRSINITAFAAQLGAWTAAGLIPWSFGAANVPLNGLLRVPTGGGKCPLVLFAHGNHTPVENSTPGYLYLCELLASHGIIAGTIDVNFLNGRNFGENGARAIVHLEHVKQFRIWNRTGSGHPLEGRVDLDRVMIVGHSRGGEAVGHASYFNGLDRVVPLPGAPEVELDNSVGLGPYHFGIRSVIALAPTDDTYRPVGPGGQLTFQQRVVDDYLVMHGTRDNDLNSFPGYRGYDRAQPVNPLDPTATAQGYKALLWIYKANHNYFNSVWANESPPDSALITRAQQETIAKVYVGAAAQAQLLGRSQYLDVLRSHTFPSQTHTWVDGTITLVSEFQDPKRTFIQDLELQDIVLSAPTVGTVDTTQVKDAGKLFLDLGSHSFLYQETTGLRLLWDDTAQSYRLTFGGGGLDASRFQYLALRAGQSPEPENPANQNQNFTLEVVDEGDHSYSVESKDLAVLPYPGEPKQPVGTPFERKMVMQTLRLPVSTVAANGLDVSKLKKLLFKFDKVATGTLYVDDIQLTN